jgi:peptidyl-prolyl cis-trans isomerase A (cyclophilin A)/peptidyl-prolyl cis-trans isomerase B (cyclophilin B)
MPLAISARRSFLATLALLAGLAATAPAALAETPATAGAADGAPTHVRIDTNLGSFTIELATTRSPLTVANFINYVRAGHYNGTIFHRVIANFVVQAGGYDDKLQPKAAANTVANESGNGLSNKRGTVGLARGESPHSGNAQFYINLTDNDDLDPTPLRWGYAVFGKIVEGMDVVERIGHTPTGATGPFAKDAPLDPVVIKHAELLSGLPAR